MSGGSSQFPPSMATRATLETLLRRMVDDLDMLVLGGGGGGSTVTANQGMPNTQANAWPVILSTGVAPIGTFANPLRVDHTATTTQPVSVSSLPLPSGAATEATLSSLLAAVTARLAVLGQHVAASSASVVLASDQPSVPVHTEFVADYDTGPGVADLSLVGLALPSSGGPVAGGTVTDPVRVDPTGGTVQPVSLASVPLPTGAATEATLLGVKAGTDKIPASPSQEHVSAGSPHAARLTDGTSFYKPTTPTDTQPVSAASLPLPAGAATEATLAAASAKLPATLGQKTKANSLAVVLASDEDALPVTGPLTDAQLRASAVPVSATSLPLPTGAATAANQTTIGNQTTKLNDGTNTAAVSAAGALKVDGSAVTQPVSAASLPLPSGAATEATLSSAKTDLDTVVTRLPARQFAAVTNQTLSGSSNAGTSAGWWGKVVLDVKVGTPTGSSPLLDVQLTEVDPLDLTTIINQVDVLIGAAGVTHATMMMQASSVLSVSWSVSGGGSPTFPNSYITITQLDQAIPANPERTVETVSTSLLVAAKDFDSAEQRALVSYASPGFFNANSLGITIREADAINGTHALGESDGAHPLRTDPTGTTPQPIKASSKGATAAANVTSTAEGTDHQALDVQIYHGGAAKDPTQIRALTSADVVSAEVTKWVGSAAPTVGQKAMASSLPVTLASDQSDVKVTGSKQDANNSTTTPLGVSAVFNGTYTSCAGYSHVIVHVNSTGSAISNNIQVFWDYDGTGAHAALDTEQAFTYSIAGEWMTFVFRVRAPYYKLRYTDGGTGSATLAVASVLSVDAGDTVLNGQPFLGDDAGFTPRMEAVAGLDQGTLLWTAIPTINSGAQLPVAVQSWIAGSTAPSVGQKTMANSIPVVLPSNQTAVPVSVNGNIGQQAASASLPVVLSSDQVVQIAGYLLSGSSAGVSVAAARDGRYELRVRDEKLCDVLQRIELALDQLSERLEITQ